MTSTSDSRSGVDPLAKTLDVRIPVERSQHAVARVVLESIAPLDSLTETERHAVATELRLAIEPNPSPQACMRLAAQRCMAWQDNHTTSMQQRAQRVVAAIARAVCVNAPFDTQQQNSWRAIQHRIADTVSERKAKLIVSLRYHRMDADFELAAGAQMLELTESELVDLHNMALDTTYEALCADTSK